MFVGDSLGKNQWESLICMVAASAPTTQTQMVRGDPLSTFKFLVSLFFLKKYFCSPKKIEEKEGSQELALILVFGETADQ